VQEGLRRLLGALVDGRATMDDVRDEIQDILSRHPLPEEQFYVAVHEAGHAVVDWHFGFIPCEVSIVPSVAEGCHGHTLTDLSNVSLEDCTVASLRRAWRQFAVGFAAGRVAEELCFGVNVAWAEEDTDDYRRVMAYVHQNAETEAERARLLRRVRDQARRILRPHWDRVQQIVTALHWAEPRVLEAPALTALLGPHEGTHRTRLKRPA
jgi:hypothetical protein